MGERWLRSYPYRAKGICSWCGELVKPPRRSWCGDACVHEWNIRTNPTYVRRLLFARDKGVCAKCGLDTDKALRELRAAIRLDEIQTDVRIGRGSSTQWLAQERWVSRFPNFHLLANQYRIPMKRRDIWKFPLWEAAHIVAVCEGGGVCTLDNYQTLCANCHQADTRQLASKLKAKRTGWVQALADALVDNTALFDPGGE